MLLAAYDAVESLASLSSRVESRFRSDKKRTLKSAPVVGHNGFRYRVHSDWGIPDKRGRHGDGVFGVGVAADDQALALARGHELD